jgi:ATP-dependent Clp protease ATP-binding subunit ClpA
MSKFIRRMNQFSPLFLAAIGALAIIQLLGLLGGLLRIAAEHAQALGVVFLIVAVLCGGLAGLAHLRARDRLPRLFLRWRRLVDILDRLTNRQELENRMKPQVEAVYIDAEQLAERLQQQVVGQNAICVEVASHVRRRLAKTARSKPVAVFLFAGPPGVGKTYLGKVLAKELGRPLLHIDMTRFSSAAHAAPSLFGAQKTFAGSESYGKLTGGLKDRPDALVLLDEFEKAHNSVHKNFLTAWNDGFVTEASTEEQVSTARALFVLTTNAAVEPLEAARKQFADQPDEMRAAAISALRAAGFAPEVLNRIDRVFVFDRLQGLDVARVAALEIEAVVRDYGLGIDDQGIEPQVLLDLMDRQERLGAAASSRDVIRAIEESISDTLIAAKQAGAERVRLRILGDDRVVAEYSPPPLAATPRAAAST